MDNKITNNELNLQKLYITLGKYKWLIFILMFISTLLMFANVYTKPSIYSSTSVIEIKSKIKPSSSNDILMGALSFGGASKIEKEIELLKTFSINKNALDKIDFSVKYFHSKNYKDIELYKSSPITVKNISIFNKHIIGKKIILSPHQEYFTLSIKNSLKDFLSPSSFLELDENQKYYYGKVIKNEFFEITVDKNSNVKKEIKFILNGSSRKIYTDIIQKSLKIQQVKQNVPLIQISFEDSIPERANEYIDTLTQSFINASVQRKNEQNKKVLTFINQQLEKIKTALQFSENKLEAYKVTNKIIQPSIQAKKYIEKLSELEIKLAENILKQKLISNLLTFTRNNNNLDAIAPSLMELKDEPTLQLITSLQNLQLKKSNLETELTSQHPKIVTIQKQMQHIKSKIIYNLKNLKSLILQQNSSLKREKASYSAKIKTLPKEERKLVNINRDYQVSSGMYNYLLKKKTENELLIVSTQSDYRVIDKAYTNQKPIKPKKVLLMSVAPLIGLLLGILIATILQALNKTISSYSELKELTHLPILGLIPELNKKQVQVEVFNDPHSRFTESYRSLRNNLPTKMENEQGKVILLTSTIASEGKTTVTSNLASVFQMAGHKSIILNLDLRKPTIHNYFNLNHEKGMSSYLSGKDTIQDIIFATKYTDLHIITSGPIPENPSELILSYKFIELLELLKERYDYIFIDSAPVGLVSDSIALMKLADQNLIIVRENFSEDEFLPSLNAIIEQHGLKNIGLVLNRSKAKSTSYGYGYGYGYGH